MSNYYYLADFGYRPVRKEVLEIYSNLGQNKRDRLNKGISKVRVKPISEKIKLREELFSKTKNPMEEKKILSRLNTLNERTDKSDDAFKSFRNDITSYANKNKKPTTKKMKLGTKLPLGLLGASLLGYGAYRSVKKLRDSRSDKGQQRGKYNV